jgi:hypothetical protein
LIADHKHQDYKHLTQKQPAFKKEAAFRTKNPEQGNGQYQDVLPLARRYITLQMFLAGFYLTIQLLKITKGWEAEGLAKEAKVCFVHFFFLCLFSSSLFSCSRTTVTATWKLRG